jgi:arylsulfatase A-like enzyme
VVSFDTPAPPSVTDRSKRSPDEPEFVDFMEADPSCYRKYNGSDIHDYSTTFYTNHAVDRIESHDQSTPLFLYLAYQAVHDPFVDHGNYRKGMPDEYLPDDVLTQIHESVVGDMRQEYSKSLYMLDASIGRIRDALEDTGMMDNTYLIVMSDNGGCFFGKR